MNRNLHLALPLQVPIPLSKFGLMQPKNGVWLEIEKRE